MKFKLDENAPVILKQLILSLGNHDVESVFSENVRGIRDKDLIKKVVLENRVLITLDSDFTKIDVSGESSFPGILLLHSKEQGKKAIRDLFNEFIKFFSLDQIQGKIVIVEKERVRIRVP